MVPIKKFIAIFCMILFAISLLAAQDTPVRLAAEDRNGARMALLERGWYFIPGVFIDPNSTRIPSGAIPVVIPTQLNGLLQDKNKPFGSLICIVAVPWTGRVSIKSQQIGTASKLFADGREIFSNGIPGTSSETELPGWGAAIHDFPPSRQDAGTVVVLHVSSFNDSNLSLIRSFWLGEERVLRDRRTLLVGYDFFTVGIMLVMAFYYLFVWLARKVQVSALAFFFLCLSLGLRPLLYGEFSIFSLWPEIPFHLSFRMGYLTMSLAMAAAPAFLWALFPKSVPRIVLYIDLAVGLLYSLVIVLLPLLVISALLPLVWVFLALSCVAHLVFLAIAVIKRETGSIVICIGFTIMVATVLLDILSANATIALPSLSPLGLVILILFLSIAMTRKNAAAFRSSERLTEELRKMNESMSRFVPSEFLKRLGRSYIHDVQLGDHVQEEITVLFMDIRSFTGLSEELGPDATFAFLNNWLGQMGPIIRSYGGFVDKYLGDGILALFPEKNSDAIACAVSMTQAMETLNRDRKASGFSPVKAGIGIHRGKVILGTIGEPMRIDTTVISDTVNIASRLETLTKEFGVTIAVSADLLAVSDAASHSVRCLGKVTVKGRKNPVEVNEIFDCDEDELRQRKNAQLERFADGIRLFFSQQFAEALPVFQSLVDAMPEDQPSHYYARMSRKFRG